jgi:hypothetical protein
MTRGEEDYLEECSNEEELPYNEKNFTCADMGCYPLSCKKKKKKRMVYSTTTNTTRRGNIGSR